LTERVKSVFSYAIDNRFEVAGQSNIYLDIKKAALRKGLQTTGS